MQIYMLYYYNIFIIGKAQYQMSKNRKDDRVFKALANNNRRKILDLLKDQPRTTGNICEHLKVLDRCTVMQHLRVLEKADLIIVKREGRQRWNYLNVFPIKELYDRWISAYSSTSVELITRLKHNLEQ
jgi:DNA-binding transcriptional ArsR family regulator